jgi:hypothetical protein
MPGVLGNDIDAEDDPSAVLVGNVSDGTLTLNADGSFTYTPNAGFYGTMASPIRRTMEVLFQRRHRPPGGHGENDTPVASDDGYSTSKNTPLEVGAPGVLGNDSDLDGDPLSAVLISPPNHGTLTLNPGGGFTYTPEADFYGSDSFTYTANDSATGSNVATVSLTVMPGKRMVYLPMVSSGVYLSLLAP